nr:MAG TPA: hypothetical protein [Caudoviricetes sp.]DAT53382.1 MAG TPA: hypothetical protein [Caudoviricetes sp.]
MLTMVTLMAWRTSTVTMRPRIPMRTCRRPTTWEAGCVCTRLLFEDEPRPLPKDIISKLVPVGS